MPRLGSFTPPPRAPRLGPLKPPPRNPLDRLFGGLTLNPPKPRPSIDKLTRGIIEERVGEIDKVISPPGPRVPRPRRPRPPRLPRTRRTPLIDIEHPADPGGLPIHETPQQQPTDLGDTSIPPHLRDLSSREDFQREFFRFMEQAFGFGLDQARERYGASDENINRILNSGGEEGAGLIPLADILGIQQQQSSRRSLQLTQAAQREASRRGLSPGAVSVGSGVLAEAGEAALQSEGETLNQALLNQQTLRNQSVMQALGLQQAAGRDFLGLGRDVVSNLGEGQDPREQPPWWINPAINIGLGLGGVLDDLLSRRGGGGDDENPNEGSGGGGGGGGDGGGGDSGGPPIIKVPPPIPPGVPKPPFPPPNPPKDPEDPEDPEPCSPCPDGSVGERNAQGDCECVDSTFEPDEEEPEGDPEVGPGVFQRGNGTCYEHYLAGFRTRDVPCPEEGEGDGEEGGDEPCDCPDGGIGFIDSSGDCDCSTPEDDSEPPEEQEEDEGDCLVRNAQGFMVRGPCPGGGGGHNPPSGGYGGIPPGAIYTPSDNGSECECPDGRTSIVVAESCRCGPHDGWYGAE